MEQSCSKRGVGSWVLFFFVLLMCTSSCVSHESILNFHRDQIDAMSGQEITNISPIKIATDDVLLISIYSREPEVAAPFNVGMAAEGMAAQASEFRVNSDGQIAMPGLGNIQVKGMTTAEAAQKIEMELTRFIKDPVVNLRHRGFQITILGEVNSPSTYIIDAERVTILEAFGLAGDLTDYANRGNILVIREIDGQRDIGRLDIHSAEILNSPYFFLKQNDVIYVEPTKSRVATVADPVTRILPYISIGLTLVSLLITVNQLSN